jgi:hypothetical protein
MRQADIAELKRQIWLLTKQRGRGRFIRGRILVVVGTGLAGLFFVDWAGELSRFHLRDHLVPYLIMIPILLLGGYLEGKWEWQDLEKKYPE